MKTIHIGELQAAMPASKQTLLQEHELLLFNGEAVARILPGLRKRRSPSLAAHRSRMAMVKVPSEALLREERRRR